MSISEKDLPIYDWAVNLGSKLKARRTDKSTVANILELFQSIPDPKEAALLTMMYIARQIGRGEIYRDVGNLIIEKLSELYNKFSQEPEKLKETTLKLLTLMKWAYESEFRNEIRDFNDFISYIKRS
jgi:endonuclease III